MYIVNYCHCQLIRLSLKPLSMHVKVHDWSSEEALAPRCRLKLTSKALSTTLISDWVQSLFPDVPPRIEESSSANSSSSEYSQMITLKFKQCFTNAVTFCGFQKNEIIIESQNPCVIAIARETLTNLANYRRIQLEESFEASNETIYKFLALFWTKLEHQQKLARTYELLGT